MSTCAFKDYFWRHHPGVRRVVSQTKGRGGALAWSLGGMERQLLSAGHACQSWSEMCVFQHPFTLMK